jgi:hypothetical protein
VGNKALLTLVLASEQNAAVRVGMSFDPLDPAAAGEKFLNAFLSQRSIELGRQHAAISLLIIRLYAIARMPVAELSRRPDGIFRRRSWLGAGCTSESIPRL